MCKCILTTGNIENVNLSQELKVNTETEALIVESGDSIEIETLVSVCKDAKLNDVLEDTRQKPFKLKLGKNKLPKRVEDLIINMKQGDRKLFVLTGNMLAPFYSNLITSSSIVFYDISILKVRILIFFFKFYYLKFYLKKKKIKKNEKKERTATFSSVNNDSMPLPQLTEPESPRSRTESVRDKTKIINEQLNDVIFLKIIVCFIFIM